MIARQSKITTRLASVSAKLRRQIDRVIPPKQQTEYEADRWRGPISIIQSGEAVGVDGPHVSVAIPPHRVVANVLYAPELNGTWHAYQDCAHPWEAAEPADILDLNDLGVRPLVFEHQFHSAAEPADYADWDLVDLKIRFGLYASSSSMLRHGQHAWESNAVGRFLDTYSDINPDLSWYLQPTQLGLSIPFLYWPHCVWVDRIGEDQKLRVFCQALTHDGYPLGVATSWPVNSSGLRSAPRDLIDDHARRAA